MDANQEPCTDPRGHTGVGIGDKFYWNVPAEVREHLERLTRERDRLREVIVQCDATLTEGFIDAVDDLRLYDEQAVNVVHSILRAAALEDE